MLSLPAPLTDADLLELLCDCIFHLVLQLRRGLVSVGTKEKTPESVQKAEK